MRLLIIFFLIAFFLIGCKENIYSPPEADESEDDILSGGAATTFTNGSLSYSLPAPNLSAENLEIHLKGDMQFEQSFVKAPALVNPGLGPLFNNNSCSNCHVGDGRGRPPFEGGQLESMLIRISISGSDIHGGPNPVPGFGDQLQTKAVLGSEPEGFVNISYVEIQGSYPDGTKYSLRQPLYNISGSVTSGILHSPRVAPSVFGLGLLEAVPEQTILANADEEDNNGDGISGKANYVWNFRTNKFEIGKFGWKANTPTLLQQTAGAYNNDMGITSVYYPMENCYSNENCDTAGDDPEITTETLNSVALYVQTLAVPSRRNFDDPAVKSGKTLFRQIGCASCHITELKTGIHPEIPELSHQTIHPYTDLLLHDMGEELADNRPDYKADGREWRTPPLWGIGLVEIVNGHTFFMHDGRARNFEEAILWHNGEGKTSKENFVKLSKENRESLIKFLKSL